MHHHKNKPAVIALIGPAGVGKTTLGKALAHHTGFRFIDLDRTIEKKLGIEIDWIFQLEGESGFRRYETNILRDLLRQTRQDTILSTGGGVIVTEANRRLLTRYATVIYLSAPLETLLSRIRHNKGRPLLAGDHATRRQKLARLLQERQNWYESAADFQLQVGDGNLHQTIHQMKTHMAHIMEQIT